MRQVYARFGLDNQTYVSGTLTDPDEDFTGEVADLFDDLNQQFKRGTLIEVAPDDKPLGVVTLVNPAKVTDIDLRIVGEGDDPASDDDFTLPPKRRRRR